MNKSTLFKAAHKLAKSVIKSGDNYQVTFGASVKYVLSMIRIARKAVKKGVLNGWTKSNHDRGYVANFEYRGLREALNNLGMTADSAYFDFKTNAFEFKGLRAYASSRLNFAAFSGTPEEMIEKALKVTKKFLNAEMKK